MPAPLTPGGDPRLARLLRRLPDLGVPVLPLDFVRIARVLPPDRTLEWAAARELLVTLLAKDEAARGTVRREFRRDFPPLERPTPAPGAAAPLGATPPASPATPDTSEAQPAAPVIITPPQHPWPLWRLALGATLTTALGLAILFLTLTWHRAEPPAPPATPPAPIPQPAPPTAGTLPSVPLPTFNDWVPVFGDPADLLGWLPPLALLCGGLLALAWLGERAWRLQRPPSRGVSYDPNGEPVFTWSAADLHLPMLLDGGQRRELVWGVQRFAAEQRTPRLDVLDTVAASARCGFPVPRFARACPEREVWLWLDTRLRSRPAVALADQIERDLSRAGLRVRRATFTAVPDRLRLATGERASPLDLGAAARQALAACRT
ncbi:hypothetical protein [uncultured Thiodictyon sp.]|uniref:hypothetical protein n=1 Tax=uncultured Thiodictyon sp. TaxID=1846217 RepID=UPI0025D15964|nr:hypothetical protein [uncultured Thiodictyon sp.]